nr:response regulator transcription factor [Thioalkalivibrio sp.]
MMHEGPIRVLLVDDHTIVRAGLCGLLQATGQIEVVGQAASSEEACRLVAALTPDVVVLDISLPGISGLEAIARLLRILPTVGILVLSMHESEPFPTMALERGALGYLSKRGAPEELVPAVRKVAGGQRYLGNAVAQRMALSHLGKDLNPLSLLSAREVEVFVCLARGHTVNEIATAINLSPKTVHAHRANVMRKLEVRGIAELVQLAVRSGAIDVYGDPSAVESPLS